MKKELRPEGAIRADIARHLRERYGEGECMCGDSMERHSDPMQCGHAPTDAFAYYLGMLEDELREVAETALRKQVRILAGRSPFTLRGRRS